MRPVCIILALILSAGVAPGSQYTPILSNPNSEPDLIASLDLIYGPGGYTRVSDNNDQLWKILNNGFSATAVSSFAYGVINFGLCMICDGSDDITFTPLVVTDGAPLNMSLSPNVIVGDGIYNLFIDSLISDPLYQNDVGRVFSSPLWNAGNTDHMVTFAVVGMPNTYIIAFEDVLSTANIVQDRDFNDVAIQVTSLHPVPEPGTLTLLGGALLLGLGLARRRRRSESC